MISAKQLKDAFKKKRFGLFIMAIALIFACTFAFVACGDPKNDSENADILSDHNYQQITAKVNELANRNGLYVKMRATATNNEGTRTYNVISGAKNNIYYFNDGTNEVYLDCSRDTSYDLYTNPNGVWTKTTLNYTEQQTKESLINTTYGVAAFDLFTYYKMFAQIEGINFTKSEATVAGRSCDKYTYSMSAMGNSVSYEICIDKATGMCLKYGAAGSTQTDAAAVTFECLEFITTYSITLPQVISTNPQDYYDQIENKVFIFDEATGFGGEQTAIDIITQMYNGAIITFFEGTDRNAEFTVNNDFRGSITYNPTTYYGSYNLSEYNPAYVEGRISLSSYLQNGIYNLYSEYAHVGYTYRYYFEENKIRLQFNDESYLWFIESPNTPTPTPHPAAWEPTSTVWPEEQIETNLSIIGVKNDEIPAFPSTSSEMVDHYEISAATGFLGSFDIAIYPAEGYSVSDLRTIYAPIITAVFDQTEDYLMFSSNNEISIAVSAYSESLSIYVSAREIWQDVEGWPTTVVNALKAACGSSSQIPSIDNALSYQILMTERGFDVRCEFADSDAASDAIGTWIGAIAATQADKFHQDWSLPGAPCPIVDDAGLEINGGVEGNYVRLSFYMVGYESYDQATIQTWMNSQGIEEQVFPFFGAGYEYSIEISGSNDELLVISIPTDNDSPLSADQQLAYITDTLLPNVYNFTPHETAEHTYVSSDGSYMISCEISGDYIVISAFTEIL